MEGDIHNLTANYDNILNYYVNGLNGKDIPQINIDNLRQIHNENLKLRQEYDQKVQSILGLKGSYRYESKMHVDSTIYANIMLSILATNLIYFVLVKM